jgi:transcriptional regulator with XRE-family HTH domain
MRVGTTSNNRAVVRDFLISRRSRITPAQAGLIVDGRRRVPGLRRAEVAELAGVSTDWYVRLEKGHIDSVSDYVLAAVARALRLDTEERAYLFDLARAARTGEKRHPVAPAPQRSVEVQWLLDSMTRSAALAINRRLDVVATNLWGRVLFSSLLSGGRANLAHYHFTDPSAREFYQDWAAAADVMVDALRVETGRNPEDLETLALVSELSAESADFRTRWTSHGITIHHEGLKTFVLPEAGEISVHYQLLYISMSTQVSQPLCVYTPEPGSPSEEKLTLLAGRG